MEKKWLLLRKLNPSKERRQIWTSRKLSCQLNVFCFFPVIGGVDYNVNYPGYDLIQFYNEPSISDCQNRCLNYNGCTYYTYRDTDNTCFLKNGMPRQGVSSHHSGPKMDYVYPGKVNIFIFSHFISLWDTSLIKLLKEGYFLFKRYLFSNFRLYMTGIMKRDHNVSDQSWKR